MNELIKTTDELLNEVSSLVGIITRASDINNLNFNVINSEKMEIIAKNMGEIDRATSMFGKTNSQTTSILMTLNMMDSSPYRRLRQILSNIEKKRQALKDTVFKLKESKISIEIIDEELKKEIDPLQQKLLLLKIQKLQSDICDSKIYVESAIKEIGMFQDAYKEICKNFNIPENWNEQNFEDSEIEHHIKQAFTNAIRNVISSGRIGMGTLEYLEQYGIHPVVANKLVKDYLVNIEEAIQQNKYPSIDNHYMFLDKVYDMFKDEWKKAAKRIGVDKIIHNDWLFKE